MAKRLAVIGGTGSIEQAYAKPTGQLFKECGLNTGNLAFWHAVSTQIAGEKTYVGWGADPAYLRNNFDAIVFPAANQLNPDWDMGVLANLFEQARLPVFVIGLGAQAKNNSQKLSFKPGSRRFIDVLKEHAVRIGVRGAYTASVLNDQGVQNVDIIGCPSNFISDDPFLGAHHELKFNELNPAAMSLVCNLDFKRDLQTFLQNCFDWGQKTNALFVNQSPLDAVELSRAGHMDYNNQYAVHLKNLYCPSVSEASFKNTVLSRFTAYFCASEWMAQVQKYDLSVGSRLHGNFLAWQAGVPCLVHPHDSRTAELRELLQVPLMPAVAANQKIELKDVLSEVEFCGEHYDSRRKNLLGKYISLITDSELTPSTHLSNLNSAMKSKHSQVA
ncbi:polysaccharide pyruvyl transferase family protein [Salinimonas lutimaris]|uniref:polysaccharide pyruvyl transferase family protein n=1 Tax=Salinimonas lutimaris TaxID=914153 RepID=UPI0010C0602D|nr:polysaccharide pyruvyl transferase family protein [Salinimonas lutimaris]